MRREFGALDSRLISSAANVVETETYQDLNKHVTRWQSLKTKYMVYYRQLGRKKGRNI
jgi:hypothetical protein